MSQEQINPRENYLVLDEDETDPRVDKAAVELAACVHQFFGKRKISRSMINEIQSFVADFVSDVRKKGVQFPSIVALIYPRFDQIDLVRADLEKSAIEQTILNCTVRFPGITADEIARAINSAFPGYRMKRSQLVTVAATQTGLNPLKRRN